MTTQEKEKSTDKCYLEYVEGYLECTYNHKAGEECLMQYGHPKEEDYLSPTE